MEKKKNCRKEVFESLRLELQEFTPQEFVAYCWEFRCVGREQGSYLTKDKKGHDPVANKTLVHSSGHPYTGQSDSSSMPPQTPTYVFNTAYIWPNYNSGSGHGTGTSNPNEVTYIYESGSYHVVDHQWQLSSDPNVSG